MHGIQVDALRFQLKLTNVESNEKDLPVGQ